MTQVIVVDLIFFVVVVLVQTSWGGDTATNIHANVDC